MSPFVGAENKVEDSNHGNNHTHIYWGQPAIVLYYSKYTVVSQYLNIIDVAGQLKSAIQNPER
jgi:hypothetical protein